MKVLLAVGNNTIEEMLRQGSYEVVDSEDNLTMVYDLLNYTEPEGLVINRLLDSDGNQLIKVAKRAREKNIKVIVIVDGFDDYEERKLVTILVNLGVTAFVTFKQLTEGLIESIFKDYPKEFDFDLFAKDKIEYREIVKSVFKEVIAVYSPLSHGSSTVASHLAVCLAQAKNCRVCLVDFNPLKPRIKEIFDTEPEYTLSDVLDAVIKEDLTAQKLEGFTKPCKYRKNLDLLFGLYDVNEYYASKIEQYEEIIEKLKFNYDYVVIDTHAWFDVLTTDAALRLSDRVVVPVRATQYAMDELMRYFAMFEKYDDFDIRKFAVLINHYGAHDLTSIEISARLKYPVLGYIADDIRYDKGHCFKHRKIMNEYVDVLNALEIEAKKKNSLIESIKKIAESRKKETVS